ncbi:MAG: alginate export family protein, partial [Flavobacteriaceae bacterium]|nr:alginate export family protein [Flavobacteriaceae bacterium]
MNLWKNIAVIFCLVFAKNLSAQDEEENSGSILDFSLLRQNDRIETAPTNSSNFYENLKELNLSDKTILSFGGSYRFQTEAFINEQFSSEEDQTDLWFLNRFQFHSHLKVSDKFELFAELNSSLITSKEDLAPVDKDELSFNQLFARYHFNQNWNLLVGRQNIRLGSGRLVD